MNNNTNIVISQASKEEREVSSIAKANCNYENSKECDDRCRYFSTCVSAHRTAQTVYKGATGVPDESNYCEQNFADEDRKEGPILEYHIYVTKNKVSENLIFRKSPHRHASLDIEANASVSIQYNSRYEVLETCSLLSNMERMGYNERIVDASERAIGDIKSKMYNMFNAFRDL